MALIHLDDDSVSKNVLFALCLVLPNGGKWCRDSTTAYDPRYSVAGAPMFTNIVDEIYESSFRPEYWPTVLDSLATIAGGQGAVLFAARVQVLNWTSSSRLQDVFKTYLEDGWLQRCTRKTCWLLREAPGFIVEHDLWTAEELAAIPIYRDFFRPRGLGWSAGTALRMPTGDTLVFSIERDFESGPVEPERVAQLNELLPHLGRSAFVAARLLLERAKGATEALEAMDLPGLILDETGAVHHANTRCEDVEALQWRSHGRVVLHDRQAQALLDAALTLLGSGEGMPARSFPVRDIEGNASRVAHIVPIRRSARDLFGHGTAMLVLTPVAHPKLPSIDLVRSLFDLTPAEARIARAIGAGQTPQEIARATGVSLATVRTQLRAVLEKTGSSRQADIVALLGTLTITHAAEQ